jgi:hypothetical protein
MTCRSTLSQQGVSRIRGYSRPTHVPRGCSQLVRSGTAGVILHGLPFPSLGEAEGSPQKKNALTRRPPVMALVCILVLAGWTPVALGDLGIPGAPVEELKQKTAPVPNTKVGQADRRLGRMCPRVYAHGWGVNATDTHSPPLRSSQAAVWAPCEGCGSVPLCRRVEFSSRRAVPKEAGLYQG